MKYKFGTWDLIWPYFKQANTKLFQETGTSTTGIIGVVNGKRSYLKRVSQPDMATMPFGGCGVKRSQGCIPTGEMYSMNIMSDRQMPTVPFQVSQCGPATRSISTACEFYRNAHSQSSLGPTETVSGWIDQGFLTTWMLEGSTTISVSLVPHIPSDKWTARVQSSDRKKPVLLICG